MPLQLNSPYIANTASNNYVSSNGSTLTVNEKSNTKEGWSKEVIVIDDDSDNDENTISQYKNKGNLDVSIAPCITTKGKLHGTDDMVVSNIAQQSDQGGFQLLENTVIISSRNEKQDLYDLYYKEVEEMLSKLDQVKDGSTDVEKADSSNTDEFLCGRYRIATTYSNDDDKGKETLDELNSDATNSAVVSAKQRIAERFKLLQPKKSNMEADVIHEQPTLHGLGTSDLRCNFCEKTFTGSSMLATHMSIVHNGGYIMETKELRPEKFSIERNSKKCNIQPNEIDNNTCAFSEKSKKEQGSLTCTLCGMNFITHYRLKIQFQKHAGEHIFECCYCGKAFEQKTQLYKHLQTHTGGKPYKCSSCGKAFSKKSLIDQHLRTHTGEKPYECPYCGKTFASKSNMNQHLRTHTGKKPYECPYCGKTFASKSNMNQHLRTHTGEKPYECSYCGKAFATKSNMDTHLRTHTGEKPYECSYCGKAFAQKSGMHQHLRTHTGGKPYECSYCGKVFSQKGQMDQHLLQIHALGKPLKCPNCDKEFRNRYSLKTHLRTHTGGTAHK